MERLSQEDLEAALEPSGSWQAKGKWTIEDGKISRNWTFGDFREAMAFVNAIAELAESENHHPDIDFRYNQVKLALVTHDYGGVTKKDVGMARMISDLYPE